MRTNNIVVLVRTRDEESRIAKFCQCYRDADVILVADGGSVDNTKEIAKNFQNVIVRDYPYRIEMANGYWRNNDSAHVNWLIDWGRQFNPDWLILDDCDCTPNKLLQQHYRSLLSQVKEDFVLVTRIYFWGCDQHFPNLAKPAEDHKNWEPSLWAWRGKIDFKTVNVPPAFTFRIGDKHIDDLRTQASVTDFLPPYALLHRSWPDPEFVKKKIETYRRSGLIPTMAHPMDFGGPLEKLKWWMKD